MNASGVMEDVQTLLHEADMRSTPFRRIGSR